MEPLRITAVIFVAALSLVRGKDDPFDTTALALYLQLAFTSNSAVGSNDSDAN